MKNINQKLQVIKEEKIVEKIEPTPIVEKTDIQPEIHETVRK